MIRSMTGFGAATAEGNGLAVRVEARSVNHRHVQVKTRLPGEFTYLEPQVDALVRTKLARGSITMHVAVTRTDVTAGVKFDTEAAARYVKLLRRLERDLELDGGVRVADLLSLPGVVEQHESSVPSDKQTKFVLKTVGVALTELIAMRANEGASLGKDLERNIKAIEGLVAKIEKRVPGVVSEHFRTLKRRVDELVADAGPVSQADLARELALIADRLDVSEELTRLLSHVDQLRKTLAGKGAIGRRLDFLAQELFREANTIGSKASDARVAHAVVDLKTHIERLREQVQNVE